MLGNDMCATGREEDEQTGACARPTPTAWDVDQARAVVGPEPISRHGSHIRFGNFAIALKLIVEQPRFAKVGREPTELLGAVSRALHRRHEVRLDLRQDTIQLALSQAA